MGERFRGGLAHLRQLGETQRCAIMCAETCCGAAIDESSPTICLPQVSRCFISCRRGRSKKAIINKAARPQRTDLLVYPADPAPQADLFAR